MTREDHPAHARAQAEYLSGVDRARAFGQTISLLFAFSAGQLLAILAFQENTGWPVLAGICTAYFFAQYMDRRENKKFQEEAAKLLA